MGETVAPRSESHFNASMRGRIRVVLIRLLAAAAVGAVACIAYLCAYYDQRGFHDRWGEHVEYQLDSLQEAVEKHRETTNRLPADLSELKDVKEKRFQVDNAGRVVDVWRHPVQYQVEGDRFTLYSFGWDGRAGGEGIDADIFPHSAGRPRESPTLYQFTMTLPTQGVQWTCFAAGVCVGLVCLKPSKNRLGAGFLTVVGITAVGAIFFAVAISFLHVPSGH